MLRITNDDMFNYAFINTNTNHRTSLDILSEADEMLKLKEKELAKINYELALLKANRLCKYREHVWYLVSEDAMKNAWNWSCAINSDKMLHNEKIDGRKNYPEKDSFNFIISWVNDYVGVPVETFDKILQYNYGQAYEFIFTYDNHEYQLDIPVVKNISEKDFYGPGAFMLHLSHKKTEHVVETVEYSFFEEEIGKAFFKFVEDLKNKEE